MSHSDLNRAPRRYLLLFCLLPLLAGLLIYVLFCPEVFLSRLLVRITGVSFRLDLPDAVKTGTLWRLIRNHLADYLWAQGVTAAVLYVGLLFHRNLRKDFFLCLVVVVLMEAIQLSVLVWLTFDWWDIAVQAAGAAVAYLSSKPYRNKEK